MKNKVMKKVLMVMLSATMLIGSASVTAFAQANENAEQTETAEQVIEEQPAEQPATEGTPFSTPGNGQLVDDKENDSSKQFLTVQTKNGNTFYMVIDRSGTSENVYMMSLVDENDLAEFLDENEETEKKEESAVVLPEITTTPEPETTVQPETEVKPESSGNKMFGSAVLGGGIVLVFGGLAAFALSKFRKKKEDSIVEEGLEFADDSYINEDEENAEDDSDTLETNSEDVVKEDEPDGWGDTKSIPNENLPEETETEEADSEESDDEEEWENEIPKKKPKKHHFFGRKKKSSAEEESGIEFIDL